jgi:hypothetical protein
MRYGPQGPRVRGCGPHRAAPLPLVIRVEVARACPMCHKSPRCSVVARVSRLPGHTKGHRDRGPGAAELEDVVDLLTDLRLELLALASESHEVDARIDGGGRCGALRCHVSRIADDVGCVKRFCKLFLTKVCSSPGDCCRGGWLRSAGAAAVIGWGRCVPRPRGFLPPRQGCLSWCKRCVQGVSLAVVGEGWHDERSNRDSMRRHGTQQRSDEPPAFGAPPTGCL